MLDFTLQNRVEEVSGSQMLQRFESMGKNVLKIVFVAVSECFHCFTLFVRLTSCAEANSDTPVISSKPVSLLVLAPAQFCLRNFAIRNAQQQQQHNNACSGLALASGFAGCLAA